MPLLCAGRAGPSAAAPHAAARTHARIRGGGSAPCNACVAECGALWAGLACLQLSKPIADNKGLKVLNLGGNDIGPKGAKALATALKVRACAQGAVSRSWQVWLLPWLLPWRGAARCGAREGGSRRCSMGCSARLPQRPQRAHTHTP